MVKRLQVPFLCCLAAALVSCSETESIGPCVQRDDCPAGFQCIPQSGRCVPSDPCAAGIYNADDLPTFLDTTEGTFGRAVVRRVLGTEDGINIDVGNGDDRGLRIQTSGEAKVFEFDFSAFESVSTPIYLEANVRLDGGGTECTAIIDLWVDRNKRAAYCIGGGKIGIPTGRGSTNELPEDFAEFAFDEPHTYRIVYRPPAATGEGGANEDEVTAGDEFFELYIDEQKVLTNPVRDFQNRQRRELPARGRAPRPLRRGKQRHRDLRLGALGLQRRRRLLPAPRGAAGRRPALQHRPAERGRLPRRRGALRGALRRQRQRL